MPYRARQPWLPSGWQTGHGLSKTCQLTSLSAKVSLIWTWELDIGCKLFSWLPQCDHFVRRNNFSQHILPMSRRVSQMMRFAYGVRINSPWALGNLSSVKFLAIHLNSDCAWGLLQASAIAGIILSRSGQPRASSLLLSASMAAILVSAESYLTLQANHIRSWSTAFVPARE